ncbi:MAG: hypothetical protein LAE24_10630 [Candidatus Contendobacter sp.]|nr:hypothetical protein [Candidatus Contendobacter sp.]
MNEQELIENPEALLALIQQAVQQLVEQRPDTVEQEAQLRAVAKAVEQLEKQRVPVPDSLRQTKMMLVDQISQCAEFNRRLSALGAGLTEVLDMIEETTGKLRQEEKSERQSTPRQRRPRGSEQLATPQEKLGEYLVQALAELGGSAHCSDALERMANLLEGKLLPGDLMSRGTRKNGELIWHNNTHWIRQKLVNDGVLRNDSERGYWELAEKQP